MNTTTETTYSIVQQGELRESDGLRTTRRTGSYRTAEAAWELLDKFPGLFNDAYWERTFVEERTEVVTVTVTTRELHR
jgi:hypothetical protein